MALKLHAMALPSSRLQNFSQSTSLNKSSRVFVGTCSSTCSLATQEAENKKKAYHPAKGPASIQVTHSMPPQKLEIFKSLEDWVSSNILTHVNPVEKNWQPHDFLPKSESEEEFFEQVKELRERSKEIPDEYLVILVASMVTEEALPTYQSLLNTLDGCRDETASSPGPWAIWIRAWSSEENRHGDLLNRYLYLSGRVDMRQVEKTTQYLIGAGMDPKWENNPYRGFIYTTFQERATFFYHGNTARIVKAYDTKLAQICGTLAADEKRHEVAYMKIVEKLFEIDPDETMLALADMMKNKITMPTEFIYDGEDYNLFQHFATVTRRAGVYGPKEYAEIVDFLIGRWNVEKLTGLSSEGRRAQDYVCGLLPKIIKRLEEKTRAREKANRALNRTVPCSWIFGREMRI